MRKEPATPRTVYKYEVKLPDGLSPIIEIEMPIGAQIIDFNFQNGVPMIWALVGRTANNDDPLRIIRSFAFVGTGHDLPFEDGIVVLPIGSASPDDFEHVFHLFEVFHSIQ